MCKLRKLFRARSLGETCIIDNFTTGYHLASQVYENKVTATLISSVMLKKWVSVMDENSEYVFQNLKFVITGGKSCDIVTRERATAKLGPVVNEYYGTTETGVNTLSDSNDFMQYPGSVGKVFEGNTIQILDKDLKSVSFGQIGRIAIHSYMNMDDYLDHHADMVKFEDKTFLLTADFGYINQNGYLFIVQRTKEAPNKVLNLARIENILLSELPITDIHLQQNSSTENIISISLVPNYYIPYDDFLSRIQDTLQHENIQIKNLSIKESLAYTATGKSKSFDACDLESNFAEACVA